MASTFGTLEWGERTAGRLTRDEQWAYVRQVLAIQLAAMSRQALAGLGVRRVPQAALCDLRVPQGAMARDADELMRRACAPWLVNHCLRTWAWAVLLGRRDGVAFDAELLHAACALHDLGLTDSFPPEVGVCFAVSGARAAEDALRRSGHPPDRARAIANAISLHLNVRVALAEHGPEAHLLAAAAALDVVGQRVQDISREARTHVLTEHPRLRFKHEVSACLREQAARSPRTRTWVLCRRLPLLALVHIAPFRE